MNKNGAPPIIVRCVERVLRGFKSSTCKRNAWKDGYCKQHHPDSVAERKNKAEAKWNASRENSPHRVIEKLEAENSNLREALTTKDAEMAKIEDVARDAYMEAVTYREALEAVGRILRMTEKFRKALGKMDHA